MKKIITLLAVLSAALSTLSCKREPTPPPPTPTPPPPAVSHPVVSEKELFIIDPAVLTSAEGQPGGSWHIRSALQRIAGTGVDVNAFAAAWFKTWADNTTAPGVADTFIVRPWVQTALTSAWAANRIRLIAIVNRIDLARFPGGTPTAPPTSLGEGRFVYEVLDASGQPEPFTLIFEYKLPPEVSDMAQALTKWAKRWHDLGRPGLSPAAYLTELKAATDLYSAHGTLNQIRTNEFLPPPAGPRLWELREFHSVSGPARLDQVPVVLTPEFEKNGQPAFSQFITDSAATILSGGLENSTIPVALRGAVAPVPAPPFRWNGAGAAARPTFIVSFNTCSGCHAGDTGTLFQHIGVNAPQMSPFLKGPITLTHPLPPEDNAETQHDEMAIRRKLLAGFAGDTPPSDPTASATPEEFSRLIKARANRAH